MDFDLTHEQQLLGSMVDRLLADTAGATSADVWHGLAELGVLGAIFAEEDGGSGGGGVETMVVMQAIGRAGSAAPLLSSIVLGGSAVARAGTAAQRAAIVHPLIDGSLHLALAHAEPASRYRLAHVQTTALPASGGYVLTGHKGLVTQGQHADRFIVSARLCGAVGDESGLGLFIVPADATGLRVCPVATQDGQGAAMLTLEAVQLGMDDVLGAPGEAWPIIVAVHDLAIAAVCAEALGAMEEACRLTLFYLGTRRQFGQAIGSFQALQHRAVDMFVALELARSMVMYAAFMADDADAAARGRAMSAAKIRVARSARLIAQEAIQLHGAIGLTEEYALGQHARRLAMIEMQFGDVDHHAARLAA